MDKLSKLTRKEKKEKKGGSKKEKPKSTSKRTNATPTGTAGTQSDVKLNTSKRIELRPEFSVLKEEDIIYDKVKGFLGDGMYGKVYRGECFSNPVAIKELNVNEKDYQSKDEYESDMECLVTEINIMMKNSHPNIMTLIGVCPKTRDGKTLIVMELEDGDLFHLLINDQGRPTPLAQSMTLFDRLKLIKEGALGMEFLHSIEPAIIHRDLKLENLMYKRIDNTIQVRLSDFGLSAIKPKSVKKLVSDGRGNNLTKAPEVVLGRDFDEKADVYSYSMCMWEMLHCVPLYPEIQSSQELFDKVVRKGMRPTLSPTIPTSLKALLERMWDADPTHRPHFGEINRCLDEVLIDAAITDRKGRKFWKDYFLKEHTVPWPRFVEAFYKVLGEPLVRPTLPYATNDADLKYHCLRALLVVDKKESKEHNCVRIQDFGYYLGWLSGMDTKAGQSLLDRTAHLITQSWFHGDIERNEAQRRLEGQKEGTFLVRLSKSTPGGYAITKLEQIIRAPSSDDLGEQKEKVNYVMKNYSITQTEEGFQFQLAGAGVSGHAEPQKNFPDVVSLIDHFRDKIGLVADCPGSRFRILFEGPHQAASGGAYDPVDFQ